MHSRSLAHGVRKSHALRIALTGPTSLVCASQDFIDAEAGNTPHTDQHSERVSTLVQKDDLLNFAIASPSDAGQSTPSGRPSAAGLSAASMSWVDEMNAELAEFDSLTSGLRPGSIGTPHR